MNKLTDLIALLIGIALGAASAGIFLTHVYTTEIISIKDQQIKDTLALVSIVDRVSQESVEKCSALGGKDCATLIHPKPR
jgi:uncharacterized protein YaaQ